MRVLDRIYYPDVMVPCGRAADVELIVEEPAVLVEVTARSSRATDRREKLDAYTRLPSLRCYVIVDQRRKHVLVYARGDDGEWVRDEHAGEGTIVIPVVGVSLSLDEIYDDVPLPPMRVGEEEPDEGSSRACATPRRPWRRPWTGDRGSAAASCARRRRCASTSGAAGRW